MDCFGLIWTQIVSKNGRKVFIGSTCQDDCKVTMRLAWRAESGVPGDLVGAAADGELGQAESAEDGGGGGRELREPLDDAWSAGPVTVFVPPTVLEKEQTVFDLPMPADGAQQTLGSDRVGIEAGEKIRFFTQFRGMRG